MRYIIMYLLFTSFTVLYGQNNPVPCSNTPFLITSDTNGVSTLYTIKIDSTTGEAYSVPFPNSSGIKVNGIGYRLKDKSIYGCAGGKLVRIDGSGTGEILAQLTTGTVAGDVSPDGKYLVLAGFNELILIDLESGFYEETHIPYTYRNNKTILTALDIAFNPSTGILYGFDTGKKKLVTIDLHTGAVDFDHYPPIGHNVGFAALYFDSYGNLWGSALPDLYRLNTFTGQIESKTPILIQSAGVQLDGCSCPGAFNFQKTAWPVTISHCSALDYVFSISNRTGETQTGIDLEDWIPEGVLIEKIVQNPFGGQLISGPGTNHLLLKDLNIPEGIDSIIIHVKFDYLPTGEYKNQAVIKNVIINSAPPANLVSDNPTTHFISDSTSFFVEDLVKTLKPIDLYLCNDTTFILDVATVGGQKYSWSNGAHTERIEVATPGDYIVTIETRCETAQQIFHVHDASLTLDVGDDRAIQSGDTLSVEPEWSGIGALAYIRWEFSTQNLSLTCPDCVNTAFYPIDNADYRLKIVNEYGCVATDDLSISVDHEVYIANVFSPSKPAPDNVFFLQSKNPIAISYLRIFDRWGNAVFERNNLFTNDISVGWDGNFNNRKAAPGVYVWIAALAHANGVKEKIQGNVTLVD